jgi:Mn2+/Fe2+ NRAMP family transporter
MYAGAAVGVSHLVQSTQAGATFGFGLVWAVIAANVMKYPFFRFGPLYATATGKSLMEGYAGLSKYALILFLLMTMVTMFIVEAAVSVVSAGLFYQVSGVSADDVPLWAMTAIVLALCIALLWSGTYRIIDGIMKVIIISLTVTTIVALVLSLGADVKRPEAAVDFDMELHFAFLISFMGWMPAPLDLSVWHSLWVKASRTERPQNQGGGRLDFEVGYWGTVFLAICFVALGALMLYRTGVTMPDSAAAFAGALLKVYTDVIGEWAFPFIAIAAFATMLSTSITCLDAFGRVMHEGVRILRAPSERPSSNNGYRIWIGTTATGAVLILAFAAGSMLELVRFITTISFLSAPVIAVLNYFVISGKDVPESARPGMWLRLWSAAGILFLLIFSGWYLIKL